MSIMSCDSHMTLCSGVGEVKDEPGADIGEACIVALTTSVLVILHALCSAVHSYSKGQAQESPKQSLYPLVTRALLASLAYGTKDTLQSPREDNLPSLRNGWSQCVHVVLSS